ncbi:MAG: tetratricopeptide repeat protein [Propionibacteriaceae bacterium]|jgi:putative thioredoxin|nr:tetratricopeptide repeat protein [Propionibacteriaceae bacterium]
MVEPNTVRGAVDLSSLARPAGGGVFVTEVTEANFEATLSQSVRFPIVIEFYSPRDPGGAQLSRDLAALANAAGGAWLLARIDVDQSTRLAQALKITAVPLVVGVLAGQLMPLWQGTLSSPEAARHIDELLKLAAANGLLGRAAPVAPTAQDEADDPRYAAAEDAMERSDFAAAASLFDKLLQDSPTDARAKAGKAQANLLARVGQPDAATAAAWLQAAEQAPTAVEPVLRAGDLEVALGRTQAGFDRLIAAIAATAGDERDQLRRRLLELLDTLEPGDPIGLTARRNLATALF